MLSTKLQQLKQALQCDVTITCNDVIKQCKANKTTYYNLSNDTIKRFQFDYNRQLKKSRDKNYVIDSYIKRRLLDILNNDNLILDILYKKELMQCIEYHYKRN